MREDDRAFYRCAIVAALVIVVFKALFGSVGAQGIEVRDTARGRVIMQRHIAAVGGEAAFRTRPTHMVMTMQMPGSAAVIRMESWQSAPRLYSRMETPGMGTTEMGFDGKTAWMISPVLGPMLLGDLPREMTNPADVASGLQHLPLTYVGVREIAGKKYEVVEVVVGDTLKTTGYFDPSSGLMAGMTPGKTPGPSGQMALSFDEWKRYGTILYATRMTTRMPDGKEIVTRVESISNDPIDSERFELPTKVRELQARKTVIRLAPEKPLDEE